MKLTNYFFSLLFALLLFTNAAQSQTGGLTAQEIDDYKKQAEGIVKFYEGTLNFLGDPTSTPKEKDIIITSSYLKMFKDDKVQIEDDLDEKRDVPLNKDVQAYLKDVHFFFKKVQFEFTVGEVTTFTNQNNQLCFKVVTTRNLQGTTIDKKDVNSNRERFFEINLDDVNKDLKIARIYTHKVNEEADLEQWWGGLSTDWAIVLAQNISLKGDITFQQLKTIVATEELDLTGNTKITGLEPLSKLSDLRKLNISGTSISDLTPLRSLTKIEVINCSNTKVNSLAPLKYCMNLKELNCSNTQVANLETVETFQKLEKLDFSGTNVTDIQLLSNCNSLKDLRFNNTNVSDLSPISNLKSLEIIKFGSTKVSSLEPIKGLNNLVLVSFDNSAVNPLTALSNLKNLNSLFCNNTPVNSLDALLGLPAIEKVYCDNSKISRDNVSKFQAQKPKCLVVFDSESQKNWWSFLGNEWKTVFKKYVALDATPTKEQLQAVMNLTVIDLSGNSSITNLEPLRKLINLKEVKLSGTSIDNLEPLKDLIDLRTLDCSKTKVTSVDVFASMKSIERLDLANTKVSNIQSFKNLTELSVLRIENTQVSSFAGLEPLKNLKTLYCDNIKTDKFEIERFAMSHTNCLVIYQSTELKDWWYGLNDQWKDVFSKYEKVDKAATTEQLHRLTKISSLEFSENYSIVDLEPLAKFIFLKELKFSDTRIKSLEPISRIKNLEVLRCANSPIESLEPIKNLTNLKVLKCQNTKVKTIKPIVDLKHLEALNVAGTKIWSLSSIGKCENLKTLEFYNSKVFFLGPVKNLKKLRVLKCYSTNIMGFSVDKYRKDNPECIVIY